MTTTNLVTAPEGVTLSAANNILRNSEMGILPIVDAQGRHPLALLNNQSYPLASKLPESK